MKDTMKSCQHTLSDDVLYKEVVVIGNGPSGMVTSFMLAGNVPYLKEIPDDLPIDEMLKARLSNLPQGQSLYETDLTELAEGLEGRSQNPIPLLLLAAGVRYKILYAQLIFLTVAEDTRNACDKKALNLTICG
ncbi:unnamed protein product [Arctia plantaginis]|uniref:Uncharacterized protein n=1 Tax=Arctia plantaginis TaxID=874455 RepID=A0A8S0ZFE0_ARCPL|nr:unnamed protein product [Arctia plantaginis]